VPFKRPSNISQDKSKTIDVIKHAINFYKKKNINFDAIMLLQPTCPLRNTADINNAINILKKNISISSVISVQDVNAFHPARMKFLGKKNILKDPTFSEKYENQPRQELRKMYIRSGLIYLTRVKNVIKYNSIKGKKSYGIITPSSRAFNIDDISDFKIAELIKKNKVY
jgi:CMP-N-acetylneuraminic acid synthetase